MLLIVWGEGSSERVTRDADLLGFGDNSPTAAAAAFWDICAVAVEDDGVQFELETIEAESIRAEQEYVGVRVTLRARVGNARIPVQADIGFDPGRSLFIDDTLPILRSAREFGVGHLLAVSVPDSRKGPKDTAEFAAVGDYQALIAGL